MDGPENQQSPPLTNQIGSPPKFAIDRTSTCDIERAGCAEFFKGKANKTPERYMTIRNYMVDVWEQTKPQYLTKIKARAGLRHCGDVNAIGRVHTFLENSNIINIGATRRSGPVRKPPDAARRRRRYSQVSSSSDEQAVHVPLSSARRRRVRNDHGEWVYEDELYGGRVISHDVIERRADDADGDYTYSSDESSQGKRRKRTNGKWAANSEFRLIPCQAFAGGAQPFAVRVSARALALMDLHAHLMYTEIIGLLGGRFSADTRRLDVDIAFPCHSTSTTTECEMDPASEVEARRVFAARGMQVVGWFHSHPTFEATPSVRDIHNQHAYQVLCRQSDIEPFVGLIVSPPGGSGPHGVSDINVFYVKPPSEPPADGVPFAMEYEVCDNDAIPDELLGEMARVIEEHSCLDNRADLAKRFRRKESMTVLEKLTLSMQSHWSPSVRPQWCDAVAEQLLPLLQTYFCKGSTASSSSSDHHPPHSSANNAGAACVSHI
ncbi:hypothetical protein EC988_001229 [Linderina pennispora]|nr:hypothetical protein EC988_001229 [Linderina pennispora]